MRPRIHLTLVPLLASCVTGSGLYESEEGLADGRPMDSCVEVQGADGQLERWCPDPATGWFNFDGRRGYSFPVYRAPIIPRGGFGGYFTGGGS